MSRLHASLRFGRFGSFGIFGLVAACGGGSATPDAAKAIDAAKLVDAPAVLIDAPTIHPDSTPAMGTMHHYVVNKETLPTSSSEALADGLDLDGNGTVDNQFGMVVATFAGQGIATQTGVDTAISHGTTIILAALQTADFTTAMSAGFMTYSGSNPAPPPCTSAGDTVCGHHLTGTGTFDIAAGTATDAPLVGDFATGTMTTPLGGSALPLPLAFGASPFSVQLIGARVKVTGASATGLTAILAGGISSAEMDAKVYPGLAAGFMGQIAHDCNALTNPPSCGCAASSEGGSLIQLLDANHDCAVTAAEIKSNALISNLFAPDVSIDGQTALSVGVKITAVAGTFTGPGGP